MTPSNVRRYPAYTEEAECQDCYKCLRHCPVKAIKVEKGRATIVSELCVVCGRCVAACPAKAKLVRDDLGAAKGLLRDKTEVHVSLAPSWVSEFPQVPAEVMIAALKRLGFAGVGETALGAQQVSAALAEELGRGERRLLLSSACPAAAEFVQAYLPELADCVAPMLSPLLAHCRLLRQAFGPDIGVVFFGPCVAKKSEADRHPDLLDAALTFQDLRDWLAEEDIDLADLEPGPADRFTPEAAKEGALYPVEGGMNATIRLRAGVEDVRFLALSGIGDIDRALRGLDPAGLRAPVFVEILACEGGCVRGPCLSGQRPALLDQLAVVERTELPRDPADLRPLSVPIADEHQASPIDPPAFSEECVQDGLRLLGKLQVEDELNCGGCGYETCRDLAVALLDGLAEASMCVHYLRKRALRKANALLRCIPAGAVIVDARLRIIECNEHFARIFGPDALMAFEACPGLEGASLVKIVPFADLFRTALESGRDIHRDALRLDERMFNVTIFTIEPGEVIGGVIFDVTGAELRRDQIAQKAREIIRKNLDTVQEIACRLGENMADTEILLRSLAEGFSSDAGSSPENALKRITSTPRGRRRS